MRSSACDCRRAARMKIAATSGKAPSHAPAASRCATSPPRCTYWSYPRAARGYDQYVHLGGDVAHLLAAGAWLGALPLVAAIFIRAARRQSQALDRIVVRTTQRFSAIGVACVGTLLV